MVKKIVDFQKSLLTDLLHMKGCNKPDSNRIQLQPNLMKFTSLLQQVSTSLWRFWMCCDSVSDNGGDSNVLIVVVFDMIIIEGDDDIFQLVIIMSLTILNYTFPINVRTITIPIGQE